MNEKETDWTALGKSMDAVEASMDRLSDALSDLGKTLSELPEGEHKMGGATVKVERKRITWFPRWRNSWRGLFS